MANARAVEHICYVRKGLQPPYGRKNRPRESLMTALPEEERTYFECPECQNYFDTAQFTSDEMEEGPWCPLCGALVHESP